MLRPFKLKGQVRILILSQYYRPEPIPKPAELAAALHANGHDICVITGLPNYPSGVLYEGYQLTLGSRERVDDIDVLRTFEYPYHGTRALGRIVNYASFMISAVVGSLFVRKPDVMYVWHPPLSIGVAAWIIARLRGIPFVYDVQDIWPEAAVLSGLLKPGFLVGLLSKLERFVYRRAHHLLVVTEGARANVVSKGVPVEKVSVMPHWVDSSIFDEHDLSDVNELRTRLGWEGKFVVLFAGNLGLVQGLETVVRAAELLRDQASLRFAFVGDGTDKERLQGLVGALGLSERVQFIERQAMEQMPAYLGAADGMLVHLRWSELSAFVVPTKTLAYLASGKPIIVAMHGAAAELVARAGAGVVVPPENAVALADAVLRLAALSENERAEMGRAGRNYLKSNFSKERVIEQYHDVLRRAAASHRRH